MAKHKVKMGEVLGGLKSGVSHAVKVAVPTDTVPYELHLHETNKADWKKVEKGIRLHLGRVPKGVPAPGPDAVTWKNTTPWKLDVFGLEKADEDGKVGKNELFDGWEFDRIPGRANITITDLATNEVLVKDRDFEEHVELSWDASVAKVRFDVALPSGRKKWTAELELPASEKFWKRDATVAVKRVN